MILLHVRAVFATPGPESGNISLNQEFSWPRGLPSRGSKTRDLLDVVEVNLQSYETLLSWPCFCMLREEYSGCVIKLHRRLAET